MRPGISITLGPSDRRRLEAIVADRNTPQKHVWRAEIVLLSAAGVGGVGGMGPTRTAGGGAYGQAAARRTGTSRGWPYGQAARDDFGQKAQSSGLTKLERGSSPLG